MAVSATDGTAEGGRLARVQGYLMLLSALSLVLILFILYLTGYFLLLLTTACHDNVVKIVEAACKHDVCIIPFGGKYSMSVQTCQAHSWQVLH